MFKVTLTFVFKKRPEVDAVHQVWAVLSDWLGTGRLVGGPILGIHPRRKVVTVTSIAPERSAFTRRLGRAYGALTSRLRKPVAWAWEPLAEPSKICSCRVPGSLVFAPMPIEPCSPLQCTRCWGRRPFYRLPAGAGNGLGSLARQWLGLYWIWMASGDLEEMAWTELADPDSTMNRTIRKRLRSLERQVGCPVFLDLLSHYSSEYSTGKGWESRICPGCGRPWNTEHAEDRLLCLKCRLFSYVPNDGLLPDWWRPLPRHRAARKRR